MAYFQHLPKVQYNNKQSVYLLAKAKIVQEVFQKYGAFYPYIVKEGYTPQLVAYEEYGSPTYDWIVMFSNDVIDPYYDWPLTDAQFNASMQKKYNKNVQLLKNDIQHYVYTGITNDSQSTIDRKSWTMTSETYNQLSVSNKAGWTPVYVYDYEYQLNENKRKIQLIDSGYISQISEELRDVF